MGAAKVVGAMLVRQDASSASAVRRQLAADLDQHGVDADAIDEVALVASELVVNAVRHAGSAGGCEFGVRWTVHPDAVIVVVEDPSTELPVPRTPAAGATSGRGLRIVEALTTDWGYELTPVGKRVWAKIALRAAG